MDQSKNDGFKVNEGASTSVSSGEKSVPMDIEHDNPPEFRKSKRKVIFSLKEAMSHKKPKLTPKPIRSKRVAPKAF
ncbi:hypothetical protein CEXT_174421 [Caerostris extrusa]|uniref:Uncharacterized protein n=1 Tax=Caerostris extrusa TaxID=172846 RepID=A0AAV4XU40_CAEEX|nr:hypothetical protein CEXT_174421 [Caerostris extrusa]